VRDSANSLAGGGNNAACAKGWRVIGKVASEDVAIRGEGKVARVTVLLESQSQTKGEGKNNNEGERAEGEKKDPAAAAKVSFVWWKEVVKTVSKCITT